MPGSNTRNLGQVAGISLGQTAPTNTALIWYDTTPSQMCHKVYDAGLGQWVVINNSILSNITYAELQALALNTGLPLGKFYAITDRGNIVATSITSTKVQYTDTAGNIVIDDLGTSQQYHVPATNLRMDGISGTFNDSDKTFTFNFTESAPTTDSYIFGKIPATGGLFQLFKFKISKLVSSISGNAISWNGGLYFNFSQALLDTSGRPGGVVTYEQFTSDQGRQDTEIKNLSDNLAQILKQVEEIIAAAITDSLIMSKKLVSLSPTASQTNLAVGDTLTVAFNKIQGWFNSLRYATGSYLNNYSIPSSASSPVSGDSTQTALGKLNRMILDGGVGDLTITTAKLANYSVTEAKLATGAVSTRTIGNSQVTKAKLASSSVGSDQIQSLAVTQGKIADKAVTNAKLGDQCVETRNLASEAVDSFALAEKAVVTDRIDDLAVTGPKIATGAVNSSKLDENTVLEGEFTLATCSYSASYNNLSHIGTVLSNTYKTWAGGTLEGLSATINGNALIVEIKSVATVKKQIREAFVSIDVITPNTLKLSHTTNQLITDGCRISFYFDSAPSQNIIINFTVLFLIAK